MKIVKRFLLILISVFAVTVAKAEVIEIWTKAQLETIRTNVSNGNDYSSSTLKLMTDLDLGEWTPIGTDYSGTNVFRGKFDGQGYTIRIQVSTNSTLLGLFGYLDGTVEHLKIIGSIANTETTNSSYTGSIAAYNYGTIRECANEASIVGTTAGGIVGENAGAISYCYNQGYVGATNNWGSNYQLGGIAGNCNNGSISDSYAQCAIDYVSSIGGITANQDVTSPTCHYDVTHYKKETKITGSESLIGNALQASFDNAVWTFADELLPELTCLTNKTVRIGNTINNDAAIDINQAKTATVELSGRTLYKDNSWNTLCLPFSIGADALGSTPLADATIMAFSSASHVGDVLTLCFTSTTNIEAGKPYLVKWASGANIVSPQFTGVTISNVNESDCKVRQTGDGDRWVDFVGTFSPVELSHDGTMLYLGSSNNLYAPKDAGYMMNTCRAYFHLSESFTDAGAAARSIVLTFDDEPSTTGISTRHTTVTSSWTALDGRRLSARPQQRGIYLHEGRKIVIR